MSLLIESIKLHDGKFFNLFYHEQRMIRAMKDLLGGRDGFQLESFLMEQPFPASGLFKCRIVYDDATMAVTFVPYTPRQVSRVKVVVHNRISYEYKYTNRKTIDKLFDKRGTCDDVLIVKKGHVTDCSYSNIVFRRGNDWVTPWTPLLKGTMRQQLLDREMIRPEKIRVSDIESFETFKLINAMLEFDCPEIEVSNIVF